MIKKIAIFFCLIAILSGCAQELGEIDRTQHNIVKKDLLLWGKDGMPKQWYFRQTVIQAPFASAFSFVGDMGKLDRGVFEIQEKSLFFYRIYEFAEGEEIHPRPDVDAILKDKNGDFVYQDKNGKILRVKKEDLQNIKDLFPVYVDKHAPLIAFPIDKHFDIIWDYNPNTGEKTNVKVENDTDRLWWEREYMRVDWGNNEIYNYEFTLGALLDYISFSIYEGEAEGPKDKPLFDFENGYFDFTNYYILEAGTAYVEEYGQIPLCWFYPWYTGQIFECVSEKIKVRSAFLEVKPEITENYLPIEYNDKDMDRFGYFRTERQLWDATYGSTYTGVIRKINRFNIWEKIVIDPESKKLDYSKMEPKPIVYYMSEDFPRELVKSAKQLAEDWAKPYNEVVESLTGKKPNFPMFILCENSNKEAQNAISQNLPPDIIAEHSGTEIGAKFCKEMDKPHRNGDLRYNFLYSVNSPTEVGLYGYGPHSSDPLTGEIISAAAYNYVAAMKLGANKAINIIEVLAGVKTFREMADADFISQDMKLKRLKDLGWRPGYTEEEAQELVQYFMKPEVKEALSSVGLTEDNGNTAQARFNLIAQEPSIEELFISPDVKLLFKDPNFWKENKKNTKEEIEKYSLRNWANLKGWKDKLEYYKFMAKNNCIYLEEFLDNALIGLAKEYKKKYDEATCTAFKDKTDLAFDYTEFDKIGDKCSYSGQVDENGYICTEISEGELKFVNKCTTQKLIEQFRKKYNEYEETNPFIYDKWPPSPLYWATHHPVLKKTQEELKGKLDELRETYVNEIYQLIFKGVAEHEVGHTLGLRHNFEASTDALNFPEFYWDGKVYKDEASGTYKPVNLWSSENSVQAEDYKLRSYQYSSVMDYFNKFNLPWQGIGLYDKAAIKYGYGELMEVFKNSPDFGDVQKYIEADPTKTYPEIQVTLKERGDGIGKALRKFHHTNYPNLFKGEDGKVDRSLIYKRENIKKDEIFKEPCNNAGSSCGDGKVCQSFYEGNFCSKVVVPYRFCPDEYAGYFPSCDIWDEGVDPYEIVQNIADNYENYWLFWGYWYDNVKFWPDRYYNRVNMAFQQMKKQMQYWVLQYINYNHNNFWFEKFGKRWEEDINGGLSGALATITSFNTMAGTFGRPVPTYYGYNADRCINFDDNGECIKGQYEMWDIYDPEQQITNQFYVKEEDGARPMYAGWDFGGNYLPNVVRAGQIYDRIAAFEVLSDPSVGLIGVDKKNDIRKFLISYQTVFPDEIRKLFGGIIAGKSDEYGWCIVENEKGKSVGFVRRTFVGNNPGCKPPKPAFSVKPLEPEEKYIFPTTRYRFPMLAAYYGFSYLINDLDKSFMDFTRIWLKGNKTQIIPPDNMDIVEIADPFSGKIYVAYKDKDSDFAPAYYLLQAYNNEIKDKEKKYGSLKGIRDHYLFSELQFKIGKIELLRSLHILYDYAK